MNHKDFVFHFKPATVQQLMEAAASPQKLELSAARCFLTCGDETGSQRRSGLTDDCHPATRPPEMETLNEQSCRYKEAH